MAGNKYLSNNAGTLTEVAAVQATAGVGDAGKIVSLASTGTLDPSVLPTGIGADTAVVTASEALVAGNLVNLWNNAGSPAVRKADASTSGKEAHGFVLAAVANGAAATVYFEGSDTAVTGLLAGQAVPLGQHARRNPGGGPDRHRADSSGRGLSPRRRRC